MPYSGLCLNKGRVWGHRQRSPHADVSRQRCASPLEPVWPRLRLCSVCSNLSDSQQRTWSTFRNILCRVTYPQPVMLSHSQNKQVGVVSPRTFEDACDLISADQVCIEVQTCSCSPSSRLCLKPDTSSPLVFRPIEGQVRRYREGKVGGERFQDCGHSEFRSDPSCQFDRHLKGSASFWRVIIGNHDLVKHGDLPLINRGIPKLTPSDAGSFFDPE
jgi:hypothetical protein